MGRFFVFASFLIILIIGMMISAGMIAGSLEKKGSLEAGEAKAVLDITQLNIQSIVKNPKSPQSNQAWARYLKTVDPVHRYYNFPERLSRSNQEITVQKDQATLIWCTKQQRVFCRGILLQMPRHVQKSSSGKEEIARDLLLNKLREKGGFGGSS